MSSRLPAIKWYKSIAELIWNIDSLSKLSFISLWTIELAIEFWGNNSGDILQPWAEKLDNTDAKCSRRLANSAPNLELSYFLRNLRAHTLEKG